MRGTATLIDSNIYDNEEGLKIDSSGTATLRNTNVYDNDKRRHGTSSQYNIVNAGILSIASSHIGAGIELRAGSTTTYVLPAPPGHWVPAAKCEVQREDPDCDSWESDCLAAAASCSMNTTDNVNPCTASTGSSCKPTTANQPCDWRTSPDLIGKTVYLLPIGTHNQDYPFACAPGIRGGDGSNPSEQTSAVCAGLCPAGFTCGGGADGVEPVACPEAHYCPVGSSAALPCPAGTFGNASGLQTEQECHACPAGHFCGPGVSEPTPCSRGTVAPNENMVACNDCEAGTFQEEAGQTACEPCRPGLFCPVGASAPLPCEEGTHSSATNLASAGDCTTTTPGYYATTGSTEQTPCPPGRRQPASKKGQCTDCEAGKFMNATGAMTCHPCRPGSFCPVGASAPLPCEGGSYGAGAGLKTQAECKVCPAGTYCFAGSTAATSCSKGTYAAAEGRQLCDACPEGKYQSDEGASACIECGNGFTCPEGSVMQIPASCDAGTYLDSASDQCLGCPAGSVCAGGASPPRDCPRGGYCVANMSQPTDCPAGRYGSEARLSDASCSGECAQGYYCEAGSVSAKAAACAEGSYGAATGLVAQANCTVCPAGTYCFAGSSVATSCSKGTYAAAEGSQLCDACPEGTYQGEQGASACIECDDGFTCPEGSVMQIPASCEPGTYLNATLELCLGCTAGSMCAGGASQPRPCNRGTFCLANVSQPTDCPAGSYQNQEGKTVCILCAKGSYCERGSTTPLPCPAGTYGHVIGLRASNDCMDAPAGFYAPAGSIEPTSCPSWGFCPGRQEDTVNDVPGSIPIVIPDGQQAEMRTETVEQMMEQTLLQLPLQVEVDDLDKVDETAIRLEVATMLEVPLSAISLDLGTSRRRLDRVRPTPVHRRLTTRQFTFSIADEARVDTATAAALAAQWSNSSPSQLSATLGINVISASAPVVTTQARIQNVTVSIMTVVDCPPGFWGANGECVACSKGTYRPGGGNTTGCLECSAGTYQPFDGGSECIICGAKLVPNPTCWVPLYTYYRSIYLPQVPATTLRTRSVASLARWENTALLARLSACAAHWLTAQHRAVAQSLRINAYARSATSWLTTPARCARQGPTAPALG